MPRHSQDALAARAASVIDVTQVRLRNAADTLGSIVVSCESEELAAQIDAAIAAKGWRGVEYIDTATALAAYASEAVPATQRPVLVLHLGSDLLTAVAVDTTTGEVIAHHTSRAVSMDAVEAAVRADLGIRSADPSGEAAALSTVRHAIEGVVQPHVDAPVDLATFRRITAPLTDAGVEASVIAAASANNPISAIYLSGAAAVGPLLEAAVGHAIAAPVASLDKPDSAVSTGAMAVARATHSKSKLTFTKPERTGAAAGALGKHATTAAAGQAPKKRTPATIAAIVGAAALLGAAVFIGVAAASGDGDAEQAEPASVSEPAAPAATTTTAPPTPDDVVTSEETVPTTEVDEPAVAPGTTPAARPAPTTTRRPPAVQPAPRQPAPQQPAPQPTPQQPAPQPVPQVPTPRTTVIEIPGLDPITIDVPPEFDQLPPIEWPAELPLP